MSFSEIKLFQVKPERLNEFEDLITKVAQEQKVRPGCTNIKYIKRFYILDTIPGPPRELTKIVKCVKYFSYWEFTDKDAYTERTIGFSSGIPSK